jgi:hypothetical protein
MASRIIPARQKPCGGSGVLRRLKSSAANSPQAVQQEPQSSSAETTRTKWEACRAGSGGHWLRTGAGTTSPSVSFAQGSGRRFPVKISFIDPLDLKDHSIFNSQGGEVER